MPGRTRQFTYTPRRDRTPRGPQPEPTPAEQAEYHLYQLAQAASEDRDDELSLAALWEGAPIQGLEECIAASRLLDQALAGAAGDNSASMAEVDKLAADHAASRERLPKEAMRHMREYKRLHTIAQWWALAAAERARRGWERELLAGHPRGEKS